MTVTIDDDLYRRTKALAASTGRTVGSVVEEALRAELLCTPTRSRGRPGFGSGWPRPCKARSPRACPASASARSCARHLGQHPPTARDPTCRSGLRGVATDVASDGASRTRTPALGNLRRPRRTSRVPRRSRLGRHHAALAIERGCEWITTDRDYARFPGLRWRHPLEERQ